MALDRVQGLGRVRAWCWLDIEQIIELMSQLNSLVIPVTGLFLKSGLTWEKIALVIYLRLEPRSLSIF